MNPQACDSGILYNGYVGHTCDTAVSSTVLLTTGPLGAADLLVLTAALVGCGVAATAAAATFCLCLPPLLATPTSASAPGMPAIAVATGLASARPPGPTTAVATGLEDATPPVPAIARPTGLASATDALSGGRLTLTDSLGGSAGDGSAPVSSSCPTSSSSSLGPSANCGGLWSSTVVLPEG